eukprot:9091854-Alexandrium_andersonii.AAC.1
MPGKKRASRRISPQRFERGSPSPESGVVNAGELVLRPKPRRRRSPSGDASSARGVSMVSVSPGRGRDAAAEEVGS